jgi:DNA-binding YbaB/EbfC family protein
MGKMIDMFKQAKQMREQMEKFNEMAKTTTVTGSAGGGLVQVTITVRGDLKDICIDDSVASDKGALIDLLIAAHSDAKSAADGLMDSELKKTMPAGIPDLKGLL